MEIQTERLCIRTLRPDDWPALKAVFADFRRSPYSVYDAPLPAEDGAVQALTERFAASRLFFAVFLKHSPAMIGYVGFHDDRGNYDLGYCFLSSCQGRGYALEACEALLDALCRLCGVKRFTAGTALKNAPSCRLLKRLGFTLWKTEALSFHKDGCGKNIVFTSGVFVKCCGEWHGEEHCT